MERKNVKRITAHSVDKKPNRARSHLDPVVLPRQPLPFDGLVYRAVVMVLSRDQRREGLPMAGCRVVSPDLLHPNVRGPVLIPFTSS